MNYLFYPNTTFPFKYDGSIGLSGVSKYDAKKFAPKLTRKFITYESVYGIESGIFPLSNGFAAVAKIAANTSCAYAPKVLKSCGRNVVAENIASAIRLDENDNAASPIDCLLDSSR